MRERRSVVPSACTAVPTAPEFGVLLKVSSRSSDLESHVECNLGCLCAHLFVKVGILLDVSKNFLCQHWLAHVLRSLGITEVSTGEG